MLVISTESSNSSTKLEMIQKYKGLTEKIIKMFYKVNNRLGYGFLEEVYENTMMIECRKESIAAPSQSPY